MAYATTTTLKTYFQTGDKPTQQNFYDLLESYLNLTDGGTIQGSGVITLANGLAAASIPASAQGTDIADSTDALTLTTGDLGKTFVCLLDALAKTVTLPAVTAAHTGGTIEIIQGADLVNSGVLTLHLDGTGTFGTNSYYVGQNGNADYYILPTRPSAANNTITITGANTNSAWGIGSRIKFTVQAANEWVFESYANSLGTGNNAVAYSTV